MKREHTGLFCNAIGTIAQNVNNGTSFRNEFCLFDNCIVLVQYKGLPNLMLLKQSSSQTNTSKRKTYKY